MTDRYISEVRSYLQFLREGTRDYDKYINRIYSEVRCSPTLSFAMIGTSEVELEELRLKCIKTTACKVLKTLREYVNCYDLYIQREHFNCPFSIVDILINEIINEARKGRFSLAEIGTSEEEFKEIRAQYL